MTYKLSQIDRTLLSAYLDGEVSPAERLRAEQLLKGSEEARSYLRDLQAVNYLSGAAIAVPAVGAAGTASVGISAKLTGNAIQAAAKRAAVTKASSALGSWGIVGLASAAAAVVAGVALSVNTPATQPRTTIDRDRADRVAATRKETIPVAPALDIDTSNLLVPPMTTSDLYAFALHGTLPIGAKRNCFITLAAQGGDSLQVKVHSKAPEEIAPDIAAIEPREAQTLDSLQRVIRTSVIHYANGGVALRADIPQVRLAAIRTLEQVAPRLTREKFERTRLQLAEAERTLQRFSASSPSRVEASVTASMGRPVSYMVIYQDPSGISDWTSDMLPQDQFVVKVDEPSFTVDPRRLGSLQQRLGLPVPPTPPPAFDEDVQASVMVGSGAGSRPKPKMRRPSSEGIGVGGIEMIQPPQTPQPPSLGEDEDLDRFDIDPNLDRQADEFVREWMSRQGTLQDLRIIIQHQDSVLRHGQMLIDSASRSVHRVDSMLNRVRVRYREWNNGGGGEGGNAQGGKKSIGVIINGDGAAIWSRHGSSSVSIGSSGISISSSGSSLSIDSSGPSIGSSGDK